MTSCNVAPTHLVVGALLCERLGVQASDRGVEVPDLAVLLRDVGVRLLQQALQLLHLVHALLQALLHALVLKLLGDLQQQQRSRGTTNRQRLSISQGEKPHELDAASQVLMRPKSTCRSPRVSAHRSALRQSIAHQPVSCADPHSRQSPRGQALAVRRHQHQGSQRLSRPLRGLLIKSTHQRAVLGVHVLLELLDLVRLHLLLALQLRHVVLEWGRGERRRTDEHDGGRSDTWTRQTGEIASTGQDRERQSELNPQPAACAPAPAAAPWRRRSSPRAATRRRSGSASSWPSSPSVCVRGLQSRRRARGTPPASPSSAAPSPPSAGGGRKCMGAGRMPCKQKC